MVVCAEPAGREGGGREAHLYEQFVFINFDKPFNIPPPSYCPKIQNIYDIFTKYLSNIDKCKISVKYILHEFRGYYILFTVTPSPN